MRIDCPYCGPRESGEFTYRGDALPVRPTPDGGEDAFFDYAYLRDNVAGPMREHWYHGGGCRAWLVVERNTTTHRIASATPASKAER